VSSAPLPPPTPLDLAVVRARLAGLVLLVVVLGVSLHTADQDRALLEDYRLPSAPSPDVWLGGSPA
jgi:hypothetical protein